MKKNLTSLFMLLLVICVFAVTESVDFDVTSDLNSYFHNPNPVDVVNVASGGIGNTGAVDLPYLPMDVTRIMTYQTGITVNQIDQPISVSAYIYSQQNGGYAAIGFSSSSSNTCDRKCHIKNVPAIGFQFYSSGYSLFNNTTETLGTYVPDIPLSWYKLIFTVIPRGGDVYNVSYELYRSSSSGVLQPFPEKSGSQNITNTTFDDGLIYPYFGIDGHRVTYVDDFSFTYPEATLPVTMSSFTATATSETQVNLQWVTETEANVSGFNIYRNDLPDLASAIKLNANLVEGTNTSTQQTYRYYDWEIETNHHYYYWIESAEYNNNSTFFGPVTVFTGTDGEVSPPACVSASGISTVFPNPFVSDANIVYQLRTTETFIIGIFNERGQLVRSLVNSTKESGEYSVSWDGRDDNGNLCSTGLYVARMQTATASSSCRMMLIK